MQNIDQPTAAKPLSDTPDTTGIAVAASDNYPLRHARGRAGVHRMQRGEAECRGACGRDRERGRHAAAGRVPATVRGVDRLHQGLQQPSDGLARLHYGGCSKVRVRLKLPHLSAPKWSKLPSVVAGLRRFCFHVHRHVHVDRASDFGFRFPFSTAVRAPAGVWCVLVVLVVSCGSEHGTSLVGVCAITGVPIYGVAGACWCFWTGRVDLTASFF